MSIFLLLARLRKPRATHRLPWWLHRLYFAVLIEDLAMQLLLEVTLVLGAGQIGEGGHDIAIFETVVDVEIMTLDLHLIRSVAKLSLILLVWLRRRRNQVMLQAVLLIGHSLLVHRAMLMLVSERPLVRSLRTRIAASVVVLLGT